MITNFNQYIKLNEKYLQLDKDKYYLESSQDNLTIKDIVNNFDYIKFFDNTNINKKQVFFIKGDEKKVFSAHSDKEYLYEIVLHDYNIKNIDIEDISKYVDNIDEIKYGFSQQEKEIFNKGLNNIFKNVDEKIIYCNYLFNKEYKKTYYVDVQNIKDLVLIKNKDEYSSEPEYDNLIHNIDDTQMKILSTFMSKVGNYITKNQYDMFNDLKPNKPLKLYRGMSWRIENLYMLKSFSSYPFELNDSIEVKYNRCTSWTTNKLVAEDFASEGKLWIILERTFDIDDIVVDTRLINKKQLQELYSSYQREVIVKPNTYNCNIIRIGIDDNDTLSTGFEGYDKNIWIKIENIFNVFSNKFIENNKNIKAKYITKNTTIFGDFAIEVPTLVISKIGYNNVKMVIQVEYDDNKFKINKSEWKPKIKFSNKYFENCNDTVEFINNYEEFSNFILNE